MAAYPRRNWTWGWEDAYVGLAVGELVREGPIRERIDTLGNTLFVPAFFLIVGSLIDPLSFLRMSPAAIGLMLVLVTSILGPVLTQRFAPHVPATS